MPEVLHMYDTQEFTALVRLLCASVLLPIFDRLGLALALGQPFGTVSRLISELHNEGYITPIYRKHTYYARDYIDNSDCYYVAKGGSRKMIWHYKGKNAPLVPPRRAKSTSQCYVRTEKWGEFVERWNLFTHGGDT